MRTEKRHWRVVVIVAPLRRRIVSHLIWKNLSFNICCSFFVSHLIEYTRWRSQWRPLFRSQFNFFEKIEIKSSQIRRRNSFVREAWPNLNVKSNKIIKNYNLISTLCVTVSCPNFLVGNIFHRKVSTRPSGGLCSLKWLNQITSRQHKTF